MILTLILAQMKKKTDKIMENIFNLKPIKYNLILISRKGFKKKRKPSRWSIQEVDFLKQGIKQGKSLEFISYSLSKPLKSVQCKVFKIAMEEL